MAGNAKVDQRKTSIGGAHDIGRLEIAKDNRRNARMQVSQHRTELQTDSDHFIHRQWACIALRESTLRLMQVPFQGLTLQEIHHQVPVLRVSKMIVNMR